MPKILWGELKVQADFVIPHNIWGDVNTTTQ